MQLNEWKAKVGAALVTPQLVLPKDDVPTSDATIADNTRQMPQRESRWRCAGMTASVDVVGMRFAFITGMFRRSPWRTQLGPTWQERRWLTIQP